MKKAFLIDGGAGRVLCSIPALEHYCTHTSNSFIIIAHGWYEIYLSSRLLRDKVYNINTPNLFNILKECEVITPEPYRLNAYFTQKCNLIQAFDILINHADDLEHIPEPKTFSFDIGRSNFVLGHKIIAEAQNIFKKEKTIVLQPFGSTAVIEGPFILDNTGRSFELENIYSIVDKLSKNYNIILMSEFNMSPLLKNLKAFKPDTLTLPQWAGIINAADYFLGCDSVGQHFANLLNKPTSVVIGGTYPENISYLNNKNFKVYDNGNTNRKYSPIRLIPSTLEDRNNENLMILAEDTVNLLVSDINEALATQKLNKQNFITQNSNTCCNQ